MTDFGNKTFRIIDNGLYVSFARMLTKQGVGRVEYYSPWQGAFPRSQQLLIGDGFDDIYRVTYPLQDADSVDLWVFLDVYHSDLQLYLESNGCRVFGTRKGDEMELHRWEFKEYLKKLGLPVQPCEHVIGFDELRKLLKSVKNKFVKTSFVTSRLSNTRHIVSRNHDWMSWSTISVPLRGITSSSLRTRFQTPSRWVMMGCRSMEGFRVMR